MSNPEILTNPYQIYLAVLSAEDNKPDLDVARGAQLLGDPNSFVNFGDNATPLRIGVLGASILSLGPDGSAPTFRTVTFGTDDSDAAQVVDNNCTNTIIQMGVVSDNAGKLANVINNPLARRGLYLENEKNGTCTLGGILSYPIRDEVKGTGIKTQLFVNKSIFDSFAETQSTKRARITRHVLGRVLKNKAPANPQANADPAMIIDENVLAAISAYRLLIASARRRPEAPIMVSKSLAITIPPSILLAK